MLDTENLFRYIGNSSVARKLQMLLRFLTVLLSVFTLAGCVLQSEEPLFKDDDGVAALQHLGLTFATHNLVDGKWQQEKDGITFTRKGKHYEALTDGDMVSVTFVALENSTWVMQVDEPDKPSAYLLARQDGDALLLQTLLCEDLKSNAAAAKRLRFAGDDCFAPNDFSLAEFKALEKSAAPAKMKLVAVK